MYKNSKSEYYLVTEDLPYGNLAKFLKKYRDQNVLVTRDLIRMCLNACSGLAYLAHNKIVHRHICAKNFMVKQEDNQILIKVAGSNNFMEFILLIHFFFYLFQNLKCVGRLILLQISIAQRIKRFMLSGQHLKF